MQFRWNLYSTCWLITFFNLSDIYTTNRVSITGSFCTEVGVGWWSSSRFEYIYIHILLVFGWKCCQHDIRILLSTSGRPVQHYCKYFERSRGVYRRKEVNLPLGQLDRFVKSLLIFDIHFFVFKSLEGGGLICVFLSCYITMNRPAP